MAKTHTCFRLQPFNRTTNSYEQIKIQADDCTHIYLEQNPLDYKAKTTGVHNIGNVDRICRRNTESDKFLRTINCFIPKVFGSCCENLCSVNASECIQPHEDQVRSYERTHVSWSQLKMGVPAGTLFTGLHARQPNRQR